MIYERIRQLRESYGLSQAELARKLDVTRSSINAWESGLSTPTTQYIVALAKLFHVSADYLLELDDALHISLGGFHPDEIRLLTEMVLCFDSIRESQNERAAAK